MILNDHLNKFDVQSDQLRFSKFDPKLNSFWIPILEKAFSKMIGNYYFIESGENVDALRMLTGAPIKHYLLKHFKEQSMNTNEDEFPVNLNDTESWELLRKAFLNKQPMTIESGGYYTGHHENECGVVNGHAMTILAAFELKDQSGEVKHKMIMIRDPRNI